MSLPGPQAWFRSLDANKSQPDDWDIRGKLMMHRLHKEGGIDILHKYLLGKFGEPRKDPSKIETYIMYVSSIIFLHSFHNIALHRY